MCLRGDDDYVHYSPGWFNKSRLHSQQHGYLLDADTGLKVLPSSLFLFLFYFLSSSTTTDSFSRAHFFYKTVASDQPAIIVRDVLQISSPCLTNDHHSNRVDPKQLAASIWSEAAAAAIGRPVRGGILKWFGFVIYFLIVILRSRSRYLAIEYKPSSKVAAKPRQRWWWSFVTSLDPESFPSRVPFCR